MFDYNTEKTDIDLERSLLSTDLAFHNDIFTEDGETSSAKAALKSIIKFIRGIFEKIHEAIEDIKKNDYPESKKVQTVQKLTKIYAKVGDIEGMTLDVDYEDVDKSIHEVITVASECVDIVERAVRSKERKTIVKLTEDISKKTKKISVILDNEGKPKKYKAKTLCRVGMNYVKQFPGENISHLEKLCNDVKKNFTTLEKRLDAPVTSDGVIYDMVSTKDLHDRTIELSKIIKTSLKKYRGTYNKIINSLLVQFGYTVE